MLTNNGITYKTYKNIELEMMLETLKPFLPHRDMIGYAVARNVRFITDTLTEYSKFKYELIKKYGVEDAENNTISLEPSSPKFQEFEQEFSKIKDIEHEVAIMSVQYKDVIGILNGEEILKLDFMLVE